MTVKQCHTCGCGYRTPQLAAAMEHCRKTGHKLTTTGSIAPSKDDKREG